MEDAVEQVGDDGDVEGQDGDFDGCGAVEDFVDFDGDERRGDDDGEPFGPALFEPEANAFGEEERCIEEADQAEIADLVGRQAGGFLDGAADVTATGVEAEVEDPMVKLGGHVGVDEPKDADAGGNEGRGLEELEDGYEADEGAAGGFCRFGHRFGHGRSYRSCLAGPVTANSC